MFYLRTTPLLMRMMYGDCLWEMPRHEPKLYFTFDDGPHPSITPFVLDQLKEYDAKATFFCIGKNAEAYPDVYRRILSEGHAVGNHTHNHLNGRKSKTEAYIDDVKRASVHIDSKLFRPPYGRITGAQIKKLSAPGLDMRTVMWSVLSGDFDQRLSGDQCCNNVLKFVKSGSIVVFHDSEKAWPRLSFCLPKLLERYTSLGYVLDKI